MLVNLLQVVVLLSLAARASDGDSFWHCVKDLFELVTMVTDVQVLPHLLKRDLAQIHRHIRYRAAHVEYERGCYKTQFDIKRMLHKVDQRNGIDDHIDGS